MIYVGLDDTDILDSPGTNQLGRHLVQVLVGRWRGQLITRHQLLEDPRVPCTRRNGCVATAFEPQNGASVIELVDELQAIIRGWCPEGSDPGLCVTDREVPQAVIDFGRKCQRELVTQAEARALAGEHGMQLFGLGGTEDGVIGALAAIGLANTQNDGRVIYVGNSAIDHYDVSGVQAIERLPGFGIDEVRRLADGELVTAGSVELGKRLRPNLRRGKIVLFVSPGGENGVDWNAERVL